MLTLFLLPLALGDTIEAWSVDDFGYKEELDGNGWIAGWSGDPWYASENHNALTWSDERVSGGFQGYGWDTPADNWLLRDGAPEVAQGVTTILFANEDNDSFGLVTNHDGDRTFYLLLNSRDNTPPPLDDVRESTFFLVKVTDGDAQTLARFEEDLDDFWSELGLKVDDQQLTIYVNGEPIKEVHDASPLGPGVSGLYAYSCGYEDSWWGNTNAGADYIEVYWVDEDGDGVPDDWDNCEAEANADQSDRDGDGQGDLCDETPGDTTDSDEPGSGSDGGVGGSGAGGDTDSGLTLDLWREGGSGDEPQPVGCGCAARGGARGGGAGLGLLLAGLTLLRRRQRRYSVPASGGAPKSTM